MASNTILVSTWRATCQHIATLRTGKGAGFNIAQLLVGATAGQGLAILLTPVLSRLYLPDSVGILSLCTTIVLLLGPVTSARYELAIVPADDEDDAVSLAILACGLAISTAAACGVLLWSSGILSALRLSALHRYVWLVSLAIAITGITQVLQQYSTRSRNFSRMATASATQPGISTGVSIGTAVVHGNGAPTGLLFGYLLGVVSSGALLIRPAGAACRAWITHHDQPLRTLWLVALRYRRYPLNLTWGGFLDVLAQKLPIALLPLLYDMHFLGLYALADRMLRTPVSLVGQASSQVLFQKMSEIKVQARTTQLMLTWSGVMTAACVVPFILAATLGPTLATMVLGEKWSGTGELIACLVPIYWGVLVVSPISSYLIVAKRTGLLLAIQTLFVLSGAFALWAGHRQFSSGISTVLLYSLSQFAVYCAYFSVLLVVARSTDKLPGDTAQCAA